MKKALLICCLLLAGRASGQVIPVAGTPNSCTTIACSATVHTNVGDLIIVGIFAASRTAVISSVKGLNGEVFTLTAGPTAWSPSGFWEDIFTGISATAGTDTITLTLASAGGSEVHPYDAPGAGSLIMSATPKTGASVSGQTNTVSTTGPSFLFAFFHSDGGSTYTVPNGWLGLPNVSSQAEYTNMSAAGGYSAPMTFTPSANYVGFLLAYKTLMPPPVTPPQPPANAGSVVSPVLGTIMFRGTNAGVPVQQSFDLGPNNIITLQSFVSSGHTVTLSWTASVSQGITGYQVFRSQTPGVFPSTPIGNVSITSYTDNSVMAGQIYYYTIQAVAPPCPIPTPPGYTGVCGNSANSAPVMVTIPTP